MSDLMTMAQLREYLGGRGRSTIYEDIEAGRLPKPIKIGRTCYFDRDEVTAKINELKEARENAS